jgi:hypothetical protein
MEAQFRRVQRATVARSALDVIAIVFLGCAFAFWGVAFWQLLTPPALLSLLSIQAVVLSLVYSLATPLLWSMLVPTTPAGQLLQKTQLRTVGFAFIVASAAYLRYQAEWMIETWLSYQPGVAEGGMQRSLALSLSIAFILIPALAWVQLSPERWLAQIQQAHMVKKLEAQMNGDLAILRATLLKAEQRALVGYANLLPQEKEEVFHTLRGLILGINDQQRAISRTLGISAELERDMMGDADIATALDSVKSALDASEIRLLDASTARESTTAIVNSPIGESASAQPAHVDSRPPSSISRDQPDDARRQATPGDAAYLRAAHDAFGRRPWTLKQLAAELKIGDTSAGELRDHWLADGSARQVNLGRWTFDTQ